MAIFVGVCVSMKQNKKKFFSRDEIKSFAIFCIRNKNNRLNPVPEKNFSDFINSIVNY